MVPKVLSDSKWERIKDFLPGKLGDGEGQPSVCRGRAVDSAHRIALDEFGHWHRVYVRYSRWGKKACGHSWRRQCRVSLTWNT